MSDALDQSLLEALLDSWDRNNAILVNLLRAVPEGGLGVRAMEGGPSVSELFTHMHYVRLVFVLEDAPEFARKMPEEEWAGERDPGRATFPHCNSARDCLRIIRLYADIGVTRWDWGSGKYELQGSSHRFTAAPYQVKLNSFIRSKLSLLASSNAEFDEIRRNWHGQTVDTVLRMHTSAMKVFVERYL
jgi:hypothetical protein